MLYAKKTLNISNVDISDTTLDRNNQQPVFVAVIDDEIDLAYLFKDALSQINGVMVFNFSDPCLALEHFQSNHQNYGVVITDYRMPGMTGTEVLEKIKAINPAVTRILMSAFEVNDELFQECNCVDKFLQKPISMVKLIDEVEMLVNTVRVPNRNLADN
jgi:response regulator RpfG family c-di-GMP phosphodiesterase